MNTGVKVFGIPVYIGIGGLFLIGLLLWNSESLIHSELKLVGLPKTMYAGILVLGILISVLLHEIGHAISHMSFGGDVEKIVINAFGGAAYLDKKNQTPLSRIVTSAAGPAVNLALVSLLLLSVRVFEPNQAVEFILRDLVRMNLILAVFNLVPVMPLDGGHISQGVIWIITGSEEKAEQIIYNVGKAGSYVLLLLGILLSLTHTTLSDYSYYFTLLGIFAFEACSGGRSRLRVRMAVRSHTVGQAFESVVVVAVKDKAPLKVGYGCPNIIYVVKDDIGSIVGAFQTRLISPSKVNSTTTVEEIMGPEPESVTSDSSLEIVTSMFAEANDRGVILIRMTEELSGTTQEKLGAVSSIGLTRFLKEWSKPSRTGIFSKIMAFGE